MPKASLILFLFLAIAPCSHAETAKEKIESLIPYIGQYPPKFSNNQEFQEIKNKYLRIKLDLDHQLLSNPNNHEARYLRGWLFTLGHNMDHPPAWQGAKDDLEFFIANNKDNVDAKVLLAYHFVNSKPEYALVAENLFKESQCLSGNKPLERAQRGIFFAIYYARQNDRCVQTSTTTKTLLAK